MIPGEGEERKKPVPCSGLKKRPVNGQRRRRRRRRGSVFFGELDEPGDFRGI